MVRSPLSGLFGKTRQAVLRLLYGETGRAFYTREILDVLKIGRGTVQRELKSLTDTGIISREVRGKRVYYRADRRSPIFDELKYIVEQIADDRQLLAVRSPPSTVSQQSAAHLQVAEKTATYSSGRVDSARRISIPKRALVAFCRCNHIRRLSLFGSVLREDFRPDSDVDVLVEFEPDHVPGLFKMVDLEAELSSLFGRKVDLRTPGELSRYFREHVLREAQVQYGPA
jgi:predicted nucleotidyltransferase